MLWTRRKDSSQIFVIGFEAQVASLTGTDVLRIVYKGQRERIDFYPLPDFEQGCNLFTEFLSAEDTNAQETAAKQEQRTWFRNSMAMKIGFFT